VEPTRPDTQTTPSADRWIALEGAVNVRDAGGLTTRDGGRIATGRLIRADNLQSLTPHDVSLLTDELGVTDVVDLRSDFEVDREGPGPLAASEVTVHHLSLLPEVADPAPERRPGMDELLPWQDGRLAERDRIGNHAAYLGYLSDRPDSVLAALRVIGSATGGVVVHCAAGKDRTGTVTGLALDLVGVDRDDVLDDYELTNERIAAITDRLVANPTYRIGVQDRSLDSMRVSRWSLGRVLDELGSGWGGVPQWLEAHGWTEADTAAVRAKLGLPA